jgi:CBS domain containing-hemolysin-like protein
MRLPWRRPVREADDRAEPDAHEQAIISALSTMRETSVREVMTPRVDVVALAEPVTMEDVALAVKESGHSRFPVYTGDLDHLTGVLFVKDLFRMGDPPSAESIARRFRKPFLVPETARVMEVLSDMRRGRKAFALVVDEHGGIEGVITVKDLVSELVGELPDEFDAPDERLVSRVDASRWLVDGGCPLDDFATATGFELPEGEYVTVGGFLLDRLGRIPVEGDGVLHDGWTFRVSEMDRRRIAKVVLRRPSTTMDRHTDGK